MPESKPRNVKVDLEPIGRRAEIPIGSTLLEAAQVSGVELLSLCGGAGLCDSCRVRRVSGELSPITPVEQSAFTPEELADGFRLACQTMVLGDVKIEIPPESLTTPQRLQVEGQEAEIPVDPVVTGLDVELPPPSLRDLRSDSTRLVDVLRARGLPPLHLSLPLQALLPLRLRAQNWSVRLAVRGSEVVSILAPGVPLMGFAVDIGTTKLAAYLVDLVTGHTLAKTGAMNPQIAYGEDVVSRIAYANEHEDGEQILQGRLIDTLNQMLADLRTEAKVAREQVAEAVVVGNTAMHHLFAGLPVRQLGQAPYVPALAEPVDIPAREIGLDLAPGGYIHLPGNIAGYVGADHVSMLLATEAWQAQGTVIAVDIGTNTEIGLAAGGRLLSCACASGPAFEGAHIQAGMRAAPGAIERVQIVGPARPGEPEEIRLQTIGHQPPVGICGSGILDAVAELRRIGLLDNAGRLHNSHHRASGAGNGYVLAPATSTGHGREVAISRKDVNEIQLAKGAIRAGINILLAEAGLKAEAIEQFIVAGAFGTYLDIGSAIRVGMFPALPAERFHQVGNAAGAGARQMLISAARRRQATELIQRVEYVELTTHPAFTSEFVQAMHFG